MARQQRQFPQGKYILRSQSKEIPCIIKYVGDSFLGSDTKGTGTSVSCQNDTPSFDRFPSIVREQLQNIFIYWPFRH